MTQEHKPIRRILVALDASAASVNVLQTAIELADRFDAELDGLFVEDVNLLRLAQLPFAREVSFFSSIPRRLNPMEMELQLRSQAEHMRKLMARAAEQLGIRWRFRVVRGAVAREILSAGTEADLLIMGKIGRSLPGFSRSGSTVRMMVVQRQGMTMILQSTWQPAILPLVLVYDGTEAARKALDTAGVLAKSREGKLSVFIVAAGKDQARDMEMAVIERLKGFRLGADFRLLVRPTLTQVARKVQEESAGMVILPCEREWFEGGQLCSLVDEIVNPVLLVR